MDMRLASLSAYTRKKCAKSLASAACALSQVRDCAHRCALCEAIFPVSEALLEHYQVFPNGHWPQAWSSFPTSQTSGNALAAAILDLFSLCPFDELAQVLTRLLTYQRELSQNFLCTTVAILRPSSKQLCLRSHYKLTYLQMRFALGNQIFLSP